MNPPLRVLYIAHTGMPSGCGRSLRLLLEGFPRGTVEAHVLSPAGPAADGFKKAGAHVLPIPGVSMFLSINGVPLKGFRLLTLLRTLWDLRYGGLIRKTIEALKPDLVHLNERGLFQAARIASEAGIPVVMHARSVADRSSHWVRHLATRWTHRYVDRVIAIDESVRWSLRELDNCEVVYNPVPPPADEPAAAATALRPVNVTFMAGMIGYKGVWDLLECACLLKDRKDIHFNLYGGNSRPKAFFSTLVGRGCSVLGLVRDMEREAAAWVAEAGLGETVHLLGHVPHPEASLKDTDINVFPSHLNGVGRSVFEAGLFGVPSVVTLADKIEDIVVDGVTGVIVRERDPKALAEAIRKLADDPELRRRMGASARDRYRTQFDARRIASQMLDLYSSLCRMAPPASSHDE